MEGSDNLTGLETNVCFQSLLTGFKETNVCGSSWVQILLASTSQYHSSCLVIFLVLFCYGTVAKLLYSSTADEPRLNRSALKGAGSVAG